MAQLPPNSTLYEDPDHHELGPTAGADHTPPGSSGKHTPQNDDQLQGGPHQHSPNSLWQILPTSPAPQHVAPLTQENTSLGNSIPPTGTSPMSSTSYLQMGGSATAMSNLIVNYIPVETTEDEFAQLFVQFGEIEHTKIVRDRVTNLSKGYGFVKFKEAACALAAMKELDGMVMYNKRLKVGIAQRQQLAMAASGSAAGGGAMTDNSSGSAPTNPASSSGSALAGNRFYLPNNYTDVDATLQSSTSSSQHQQHTPVSLSMQPLPQPQPPQQQPPHVYYPSQAYPQTVGYPTTVPYMMGTAQPAVHMTPFIPQQMQQPPPGMVPYMYSVPQPGYQPQMVQYTPYSAHYPQQSNVRPHHQQQQ